MYFVILFIVLFHKYNIECKINILKDNLANMRVYTSYALNIIRVRK